MAHATAFADLTTAERLQYAEWNTSYDTLQVAPGGNDLLAVYELFNIAADHYTDGQSVATYSNGTDFYAERGFKSLVSDWTVSEGSQIVGMYREMIYSLSVDLTSSTGTVWNTTVRQGLPYDSWDNWTVPLDGSRNIDVGALGAVNMSLTMAWKAAANDDPVWADGVSDEDKEYWKNRRGYTDDYSATTVYDNQLELNAGVINMVAYDVTDLARAMGYADIENAFMFTWEAWNYGDQRGKLNYNSDFNDMVYIMTNVTPNATPEPATMLIFGLGIAGVAAARRMKRK